MQLIDRLTLARIAAPLIALAGSLLLSPSLAATAAGVYAILDEVELEPSSLNPDRVRLSGVFVVPQPRSSGLHLPPARGHLYFSLNPDEPEASRRDWHALREAAGTGEVVGFAEYWVKTQDENLRRLPERLRSNSSTNASLVVELHTAEPVLPAPYPRSNARGIVTAFGSNADVCPRFGKSASDIIAGLRQVHAPAASYPPLPVCAERIGLIDSMHLDQAFLEQLRDEDWADAAENLLIERISTARPELTHFAVECRETICHATFTFPTLEYREEIGQQLVYEAMDSAPGFAPGGKSNPSFGPTPGLDFWIQRRRPE